MDSEALCADQECFICRTLAGGGSPLWEGAVTLSPYPLSPPLGGRRTLSPYTPLYPNVIPIAESFRFR